MATIKTTEEERAQKAKERQETMVAQAHEEWLAKVKEVDRDIVLEAVRQNWYALDFASEDLRRDREFVREAMRHNGYALGFASKGDRDVRDAVRRDAKAVRRIRRVLNQGSEVPTDRAELAGPILAISARVSSTPRMDALACHHDTHTP